MKILFIAEFFPTGKDLKFSGGVEARTFFVARNLAKKHQVDVICTKQKGSKKFEKIGGISIHRVQPIIDYSESAAVNEIPSKIRFILNAVREGAFLKPDIVDGGNFIAHLISKQISIKNKIPVVFWYPDVFIGQWFSTSGIISGSAGWLLEKFNLLRGADHFIAISKSTLQKLEKQKIQSRKMTLINCGVDPDEFKIKIDKNRKKTTICISRLVSYKRIKDLVLAFALLLKKYPTLRLAIVGSGPEKTKLIGLGKNLKILNKIIFWENLPRIELIKRLKSSYLFCLPSAVEGFGITILEAAAAGIPFVVSNINVFKEITKNGKGGLLFELGSIYDLSKKIETLLTDKNLYIKKVYEAKSLAKIYNWQDVAIKTEDVYKKLLNEKN